LRVSPASAVAAHTSPYKQRRISRSLAYSCTKMNSHQIMKTKYLLPGFLLLMIVPMSFAQESAPAFRDRLQSIIGAQAPSGGGQSNLTKFDLDFPGGTPKELIGAIQKASGRPLNAIVPEEFADTQLPALKMKNVSVQQLFQALTTAGQKTQNGMTTSTYSFQVGSHQPGQINLGGSSFSATSVDADTIWTFSNSPKFTSSPPPKVCRFYSLSRYLESGTTVDDITTAIKTGAEMLGAGPGPTIRFHKDTKLLIAVGWPSNLEIIDSVLKALDSQTPRPHVPGPPTPGQLKGESK
jgi:hypothetical protein